jgi:transcription antitermination factor NusG
MAKLVIDNYSTSKTKLMSDNINQLSQVERRWFAIYTKVKCEKYVKDNIERKGIECYVPLMSKSRRYTRKVKHFEVPLINCYAFVHITKDQYLPVLETEHVFKFIKQGKDLIAIPENEISILKKITGFALETVNIRKSDFLIGTEVEVSKGNLAGIKGRIVNQNNNNSFVVELINIGYQFRIDIDADLLSPIINIKTMAS